MIFIFGSDNINYDFFTQPSDPPIGAVRRAIGLIGDAVGPDMDPTGPFGDSTGPAEDSN